MAFFVAGETESLSNFFLLFDGYLSFKNKQLAVSGRKRHPNPNGGPFFLFPKRARVIGVGVMLSG